MLKMLLLHRVLRRAVMAAVCIALPCVASAQQIRATYAQDEAVLAVIVESACTEMQRERPPRLLILQQQSHISEPDGAFHDVPTDAGMDFLARNMTSVALPKLPDCPGVQLASAAAIEKALRKDSWRDFRRTFNGAFGVTRLSLPGYSSDGNVAVVEVSTGCGELCGLAVYWILRRSGDAWAKDRIVTIAIS